jgi:hypothetical protein
MEGAMQVKFETKTGMAERYVVDASVTFTEGTYAGKTISGFRIFRAPEGTFYAVLPTRYAGGRYVDDVTFANAGETKMVKDFILSEAAILGLTK